MTKRDWLGTLQDAAGDPSIGWHQICDLIGGALDAQMVAVAPGTRCQMLPPGTPISTGYDAFIADFLDGGWEEVSPRAVNIDRVWTAGHLRDRDIMTADEIARSVYHNEFLARFDLKWFLAVPIHAGRRKAILGLHRSPKRPDFTRSEIIRAKQLGTVLGRRIVSEMDVGAACVETMYEAFTASGRLVLVVGCTGRVVGRSADDLRMMEYGLKVVDGRIQALDKRADVASVVAEALAYRSGKVGTVLSQQVLGLPDGSSVIVEAFPLRRDASGALSGAAAIVTARMVQRRNKEAVLTSALGLTPRESEVALLLADGVSPQDAARKLGISVGTIRNHLQSLYRKTETSGQSHLVALLAKILR